jgi:hypothetical protein
MATKLLNNHKTKAPLVGKRRKRKEVPADALVILPAPLPAVVILSPRPNDLALNAGMPFTANGYASRSLCMAGLMGVLISAADDSVFTPLTVTVMGTNRWSTTFTPAAGTWILQISTVIGASIVKAEVGLTAM